jgi:two-component system, cell cycle sensor histidine kinase and response regulator CckA
MSQPDEERRPAADHQPHDLFMEDAQRTQRLLQAAGVGLWDWNLVTNALYLSPEWKRHLGFAEHELANAFESWGDRLHPEDRATALYRVEAFRNGDLARYDVEFRLRHRDGSYRWILARGDLVRNAEGTAIRMMGSHVDITERKLAEAARAASEERLTYVLEATQDGVWDWSIPAGTVYFSPQWERLLGYEPGEVPQRVEFFFTTVHPDDVERITHVLNEHLGGRTPTKQDEIRLRTKDGTYRWFLDRGQVVARDETGAPLRMVGAITDITARKQAEAERARLEAQLRQAQKLESVGRLAGGVAHDFNNMLGVILGYAELALGNLTPAHPVHSDLLGIRDAATRSADITRQLLAFARQQSVVPEVISLEARVRGMLQMLPRLLGEDVEIVCHTDPDTWPVRIDPSQIDQILTNLCVNARKAISDVGTITIETGNCTLDAAFCANRINCVPGDYVRLVVRDTGAGMDALTLSHLFEPFFTTDATGERTGLGLATVFGAVSQNHGFIEVSSEPGKGSTFEIFLPRHEGAAAPDRITTGEHATHGGQQTVLVVEDEPALLRIAAKMLESQGYVALPASGPQKAIEIATAHPGEIDLLLTDVIMPGMNGHALANAIETIRPGIPRIFMSGYPADVIANHGVLDDHVAFIHKPFRIAELAAAVRDTLEQAADRSAS